MLFSPKYKPLFKVMPEVRYFLVKGGRASGKSYAVNTSQCVSTYRDPYNILFARYTMTSAEVSVIPEFRDKAKLTTVSSTSIVEGGAHDVLLKDKTPYASRVR